MDCIDNFQPRHIMQMLACVCFITFFSNGALASKILLFHSAATHSHKVSMFPLADILASRGHEVTYMSPLEPISNSNPKVNDIYIPSLADFSNATLGESFSLNNRISKSMPYIHDFVYNLELMGCQVLLTSPEFKSWIENNPKIDLIIQDITGECALAIAHKLGAKVIIYNTLPFGSKYNAILGVLAESGTVDGFDFNVPSLNVPDTFLRRLERVLRPLMYEYRKYQFTSAFEEMFKSALGVMTFPSMYDLYDNIALVLQTGNFISDQPRSLPPMFVSVPALHVTTTNESHFSKELDNFINSKCADGSSNEGFVYISLGTVVVTAELPEHIRQSFFKTIEAFPKIKFLWRWSGTFPKEKPDNLYISKWFPQQDLLSHPKIRAFVTQVGRPSMQEALSRGVPMIAFPVLGDQDFNAMRLEEIGAGIKLELTSVTESQFTQAVSKALYDLKFRKRVKEVSQLFQESPVSAKDSAIWWVEYVLRHEDFTHLKPMGRNQTWYQRRMLDVWFTVFIVALGIFLLSFSAIVWVLKNFLVKSKQSKVEKGRVNRASKYKTK